MGWLDDYHERYIKYIKYGTDYRNDNKYNDPMFYESNMAMVRFCSIINTIGGIELSEYQLDVLKVMLPYIVQTMYNKFWSGFNAAIMKLYGIDKKDIEAHRIVSSTARREGKTTVYISMAISAMLTIPTNHGFEFRIAMPAHKEKTSRETLKKLKDRIFGRDDFKKFVVETNNEDILKIREPGKRGFVEVHAFPGGKVS
jgi:hypothetical protein